jgi:hypothetical protein
LTAIMTIFLSPGQPSSSQDLSTALAPYQVAASGAWASCGLHVGSTWAPCGLP